MKIKKKVFILRNEEENLSLTLVFILHFVISLLALMWAVLTERK